MIYRFLVLLVLLAAPIVIADCDGTVEVESSDADHWQARLLLVSDVDIESWAVAITFDMEVDFIESAMADVTGSGKAWTLTNKEWDGGLNAGDELSLRFIVIHSSAEQPFPTDVTFNDEVTKRFFLAHLVFPGAVSQGDLGLQRRVCRRGRRVRLLDRPCRHPWSSQRMDSWPWLLHPS